MSETPLTDGYVRLEGKTTGENDTDADPFSQSNLAISQFILSARIYDVLMTMLNCEHPQAAADLLELHASGAFLGPQPSFNGQFITDLVNSDDESTGSE